MKILIIKPSSFGDIIQAAPAANSLRMAYPNAKIDWLVFTAFADVVALIKDVDDIVTWDKRGGFGEFLRVIRQIRKNKYDIVIDLQGLLRSAAVAFFSGAKTVSGVAGMKELSGLLVKEPPYKHIENGVKITATLRNIKAVEHITKKTFPPVFNMQISEEAMAQADKILNDNNISGNAPYIAVLPFARGRAKNWPIAYYAKLFDIINKSISDCKIVILGAECDKGKFKNAGSVVDLCGSTNIAQLGAILKKSLLAVGADTGPMHLSVAIGTPSIFIFGGSDANETAPYIGKFSVLKPDVPCAPCRGRGKCSDEICLKGITPQSVYEEILKWKK